MAEPTSFVRNCLLKPRHGEVLFTVDEQKRITASLDGYAVVPVEEYEALLSARAHVVPDPAATPV